MNEMRAFALAVAASTVLAGCGTSDRGPENAAAPAAGAPVAAAARQSGGAAAGDLPSRRRAEAAAPAGAPAEPCLMQDRQRLRMAPLRAVGTEPFWGARIEGRCVTYSHPEDPRGTRIWTRFTPAPGGGVWAGALGGRRFELRTRAQPGCSDGMSDRKYPLAVELTVGGERRRGCAVPI